MFHKPRPGSADPAIDRAWQPTQPGGLPEPTAREQPPLRELLQGLDVRELEGETLFDQHFGPASDD